MSNNVFISPQDNNVSLSTNNNILVITDSDQNQVTVSQPVTNVIQVNTVGPQGTTGPQGIQGPTGSLSSSNSGSFAITGSLIITGSSDITNLTASNALITGNVVVLGTASINTLVVNQTQLSTGSNQLGDAANDTQTLYGTVRIPTGSLTVTGSTIISSSAATQFQVGDSLLFVSSSGRVGIGTISPLYNLHTIGTIAVGTANSLSGTLRIENSGGNTGLILRGSDGNIIGAGFTSVYEPYNYSTADHNFNIGHATAGNFNWYVGTSSPLNTNTFLMRLTRSGSLGIGITSPQARLHISSSAISTPTVLVGRYNGQSSIKASSDANGGYLSLDSSGSSTIINHYVTDNVWIATGGGNVGVGSNNPTARLHVKGLGTTSSTTTLRVENTNTSASLIVLDDGNIGIGTTNPQFKLDLSGSLRMPNNAGLYMNSTTGDAIQTFYLDSGNNLNFAATASGDTYFREGSNILIRLVNGGSLYLGGTTATSTPVMKIMSAGSVGIGMKGVNPTAVLQVSGSSTSTILQLDSPVSSSILFVSGSGNIGIGIPTPNYKLDISGSTFARKLLVGSDAGFTGAITQSDYYQRSTTSGTVFIVKDINNNTIFAAAGSSGTSLFYSQAQNIGLGPSAPTAKVQIQGNGATSATTTFLIQNSTPSNLMTVLDNGQFTIASPIISLPASQSAYTISQSISASNIVGGQYYAVNITPTFWQTTASQTETAFRVAATFTQSSVFATTGSNIIADFGATSVGSQLTITDVTSGSIYMVNDVSGLPIIEATSDWTVNMYNFPNIVFQKTGSNINITGSLRVTGSLVMSPTSSFVFPLSQSASPLTGSAYWSGSLLFIWDGSRYRSSSFA